MIRRRVGFGRGVVLLEAMLAIAVFVMAGTAILVLVERSLGGLERARLAMQASDVARSAMARIEAGIGTPQTLNGPVRADDGGAAFGGTWELRIQTEPSQFTGLTRITVTALKLSPRERDGTLASYTLRQLVRLSGKPQDTPGPEDPLANLARSGDAP